MPTEYFEDIKLHQKRKSRGYQLSEQEIIDFAKQWDPQPFHIDHEFAKSTKFGGLSASGAHLIAICVKLGNEKNPTPAWMAGLGWDKVRFLSPARPGDVLTLEIETTSKRESKSDPNAGIVHFAGRLLNQHGEPVLAQKGSALVAKRRKL